tara:strand:- start:5852 stop:6592 length:741 start_codon:yes stop_codon:yes gene_type:complete
MADLSNSNSSFIPKKGPRKRRPGAGTRRIYVFTLFAYILLFATLLATGALYFYNDYNVSLLNNEVKLLRDEVAGFTDFDTDIVEVEVFDTRLQMVSDRLNNAASMVSVLNLFEEQTVRTVKVVSLDLAREGDDRFTIEANVETDSYDSTIFQRDEIVELVEMQKIDGVEIEDLQANNVNGPSVVSTFAPAEDQASVRFKTVLSVPLSEMRPIITDVLAEVEDTATTTEVEVESDAESELEANENSV